MGLFLWVLAVSLPAQEWSRDIFPPPANAPAELTAALHRAAREHKRVLLDFGGNWCGDCQVLDIYMHRSPNQELVAKNFVVVHVDIGRYDKNVDLAKKYGIPLAKGVPALAVLSPTGRMLYSQKQGEFENMRNMDPASLTAFLTKWKPAQ